MQGFSGGGPGDMTPEDFNSIVDQRRSICSSCPSFDQAALSGNGQCGECLCPTMGMTRNPSKNCPLGKWLSVDVVEKGVC